ncbi:MAG: hypothetical protein H7Y30_18040 [Pyrinomonadaceae bacterium]|nr:hypothetical protein [Pyrinomonadaceae bacterium]
MSTASPEIQELARRLIAVEAARDDSPDARVDVAAVRVGNVLRLRLIRLAGVDGFSSLLSRALTLAKMEVPSLNMVRVGADGSLEGFDGVEGDQETAGAVGGQAAIVLISHLLQLLVTFIGKPLTLSLVRDAWPDVPMDGADSGGEDRS